MSHFTPEDILLKQILIADYATMSCNSEQQGIYAGLRIDFQNRRLVAAREGKVTFHTVYKAGGEGLDYEWLLIHSYRQEEEEYPGQDNTRITSATYEVTQLGIRAYVIFPFHTETECVGLNYYTESFWASYIAACRLQGYSPADIVENYLTNNIHRDGNDYSIKNEWAAVYSVNDGIEIGTASESGNFVKYTLFANAMNPEGLTAQGKTIYAKYQPQIEWALVEWNANKATV